MAFTTGLELANGGLAFAEHQNVELMGARGNQVIDGVGVTPQGSPDLTVAVASGNVLAGGVVVAVSAEATFAGTPNTFSTTQGNLTSGQAEFVFVHIDSSGVITNTEGGAAAAGQQLPPDVPEDEVVIAMITLTEGDTTIDSVDIEDWKINVPKGGFFAGNVNVLQVGSSGNLARIIIGRGQGTVNDPEIELFRPTGGGSDTFSTKLSMDFDVFIISTANSEAFPNTTYATRLTIDRAGGEIKNPVNNAGFFTGAADNLNLQHDGTDGALIDTTGRIHLIANHATGGGLIFRTSKIIEIQDGEASNVVLWSFDTSARTLTIGASADNIVTTNWGNFTIKTSADPTIRIENSDASLTTDQILGTLEWFENDASGPGANLAGAIEIVADSDFSTNQHKTRMVFYTQLNATLQEALRLDTTLNVKNRVDNAGFFTGVNDDLRMYNIGNDGYIEAQVAQLYLVAGSGQGILNRLGGQLHVQDLDDSNVSLFVLDTSARTLTIGAAADPISVTIENALDVRGNITLHGDSNQSGQINFASDAAIAWDEAGGLFTIDQDLQIGSPSNVQQVGINAPASAHALVIGDGNPSAASEDEAIAELFTDRSSIRWKEHIRPIENPLEIVNKLNPVKYCKIGHFSDHHRNKIGFIAEELGEHLPSIVSWEAEPNEEDGKLYATGIGYGRITALNTAAIQELHKLIKEIKQ